MNAYSIKQGIMLSQLKIYLDPEYVTLLKDDRVNTRTMREMVNAENQTTKAQPKRTLTQAQERVFLKINDGITNRDSKPFLLWGVTVFGRLRFTCKSIQSLFDKSPKLTSSSFGSRDLSDSSNDAGLWKVGRSSFGSSFRTER